MSSRPPQNHHQPAQAAPHPLGTSPTTTTFLALPKKLRLRIYHEAGLHTFQGSTSHIIKLNPALKWSVHSSSYSLVSSLLLVSRAISVEVEEEFYSSNKFIVQESAPWGLLALNRLSDRALSAMMDLTVILRSCSCRERFDRGFGGVKPGPIRLVDRWDSFDCEPGHKDHIKPMNDKKEKDKTIIEIWTKVATRLAKHANAELRLDFLCDCSDITTASKVVAPLYQLPTLKRFGIRLAKYHDEGLQPYAEGVYNRITGRSPTSTFHRWNDLPFELRARILEYTGLVAPRRDGNQDIFWHQRWGYFHPFQHGSPLCGDICSMAYASTSSTCLDFGCDNYHITRSLFLVSKKMKEEASTIFFSRNNFVVVPTMGFLSWGAFEIRAPDTQEVELFLKYIGQSNIAHLRRLEIVISPHRQLFGRTTRSYYSWLRAINQLKDSANLPALTLSISYFRLDEYEQANLKEGLHNITVLEGLKGFWANEWTPELDLGETPTYKEERIAREEDLERSILGEKYEALTEGKANMVRYDDAWRRHDDIWDWVYLLSPTWLPISDISDISE